MLHYGGGHAVDHEHHVGAIALAGRRLEPPLPRDVQDVCPGRVEVYEPDLPVALLGLVVPLPLATQPCQHLAVAFNGGWKRLEVLDHRPDRILRHPGVEAAQGLFQHASKQKPSLAAFHGEGVPRRQWRPTDLRRVADHRELDAACFCDVEFSHGLTLSRPHNAL